jgi:NADP-dependent 3-hydroxy acid dehydrogenase YdfG
MEIKDKVVIVTGASQGIGHATSKYLTAQGAKVVLAARSAHKLNQLEKELPGSFAIPTDMTKDDDVKNLVEKTIQKFGRVDILVNLAGQSMWIPVEKIEIDQYRKLMELNVYGYLRAMQAVIPIMRKQGGGMIVNVSSMTTARIVPNVASYASTKHAVNSLTLTARAELEKDNIVVSLIRPKLVDTDFGKNAINPEPDALRDPNNPNRPPVDTPEYVAEKIGELIRSGEAELNL